MKDPKILFMSLVAVYLLGFYVSYLYGRTKGTFRWVEYGVFCIVPVSSSLALSFIYGVKIIYLFLLSAGIGMFLEYTAGMAYHKTFKERLWTYSLFSLGGYTSWLTLPMWGSMSVALWVLGKAVGL